jgi:hypothetical protein
MTTRERAVNLSFCSYFHEMRSGDLQLIPSRIVPRILPSADGSCCRLLLKISNFRQGTVAVTH